MNEPTHLFTCQDGEAGRLDKFLVAHLPDFSRSRLQTLIHNGFVTVNGNPAIKAGFDILVGQQVGIYLPPPEPSNLVPEDIPLDIVFENADLLVVNKPAGMVVHPAAGHYSGTLVHAALAHAPEIEGIGGVQRPGVVHRLDKDTSGLILLAKNDRTQHWLQNQFSDRRVKKVYLALVDGRPPTPTGRIEAAIGRDSAHRKKMAIVSLDKGRAAVSEYFTRQEYTHHSLLEVYPHTGRTHQIRLHLAFLGTPITGDTIYGHQHPSVPIKRHFLHAARLTFILPGETQARSFEAVLPLDLQQVLDNLQ